MIALRLMLALLLVLAIYWGRANTPDRQEFSPIDTHKLTESQLLWRQAWAGPVPGFAADMAVLNIFNIYAQATEASAEQRAPWWAALKYQLQFGQHMDPYFRDIYRLTEGLLAYEAQEMDAAIEILSKSEPYLRSSDPLLVAAFIAHQELSNNHLALSLARRAAQQPDSNQLVLGFATRIITGQSGCLAALDFLRSRLETMPEKYRHGIIQRIRKLREGEECQKEIRDSRSLN